MNRQQPQKKEGKMRIRAFPVSLNCVQLITHIFLIALAKYLIIPNSIAYSVGLICENFINRSTSK